MSAQAATREDYDAWKGYTEANIRHVVGGVERSPDAYLERGHPFQRSYLKPRQPAAAAAGGGDGGGGGEEEPYVHHWYVGLRFDTERMKRDKKKSPNMTRPVREFKEKLLAWPRRREGMNLSVTVIKVAALVPRALTRRIRTALSSTHPNTQRGCLPP